MWSQHHNYGWKAYCSATSVFSALAFSVRSGKSLLLPSGYEALHKSTEPSEMTTQGRSCSANRFQFWFSKASLQISSVYIWIIISWLYYNATKKHTLFQVVSYSTVLLLLMLTLWLAVKVHSPCRGEEKSFEWDSQHSTWSRVQGGLGNLGPHTTSQLAELLHRHYQTTEAIAFLTNWMIFMPLVCQ